MRIGLLTGGGDCPGLNAAIRAVVRVAATNDDEIIGFHHGWRGVAEGDGSLLTVEDTKGLLQTGGTILRTALYHPDEHEGGTAAVLATYERERLDAVIVIGGDGTLTSANRLAALGLQLVGIPKTIDNDVFGTQRCIGFDTAVATATEAIDRVQTTGESHDRLMVVEVMGRTSGWLAVCAGIAAGADALCLPEEPVDLDNLAKAIQRRHDGGSTSSVVVVAEGALIPSTTEGSAGARVAASLADRTGYDTRLTVLGHIQRGGPPIASDRILGSNCGVAAMDAVHSGAFTTLVSSSDNETELRPLSVVGAGRRPVPEALLAVARQLTAQ
ncbi:MAG: ATP-dependent 6-phosphofructokinase [Acidimicrobiales bacterium]